MTNFVSRVERRISAGHFAGPEGHRCRTQHGHDFKIVVVFHYTDVDEETGWGPDFGAIKKVIDRFDHQNLNDLQPFSGGMPASSENLCRVIAVDLADALDGREPYYVEVWEGQGNSVRWYP